MTKPGSGFSGPIQTFQRKRAAFRNRHHTNRLASHAKRPPGKKKEPKGLPKEVDLMQPSDWYQGLSSLNMRQPLTMVLMRLWRETISSRIAT